MEMSRHKDVLMEDPKGIILKKRKQLTNCVTQVDDDIMCNRC